MYILFNFIRAFLNMSLRNNLTTYQLASGNFSSPLLCYHRDSKYILVGYQLFLISVPPSHYSDTLMNSYQVSSLVVSASICSLLFVLYPDVFLPLYPFHRLTH